MIKRILKSLLGRVGLRVIRTTQYPQLVYEDTGRTYIDNNDVIPNFRLRPGVPQSYAGAPTVWTVNNGTSVIEEEILYSHLTLLKLLKHFYFETVLDIGSHQQREARILRHVGKKVITVEIVPGYDSDYREDYLRIDFGQKFDAIWCSQVLEHQRNVGVFLEKIFNDLKESGVFALTVPFNLSPHLDFGHCNIFSPLIVLYHLVLAGFDCSRAAVKCYNNNIGIIVVKKSNNIYSRPFASLPNTPDKQDS